MAPAAATGGDSLRLEIGGSEVESTAAVSSLPGVAVLAAAGQHGPGTGLIRASETGEYLQFKASGSDTWGKYVYVPSDGEYILTDGEDRDKWVRVSVYNDYLAPGETTVSARGPVRRQLRPSVHLSHQ